MVQRGVGISTLLPFRPVAHLAGNHPTVRTLHEAFTRLGLGAGKRLWIKLLSIEPERPEGEQDFALGVQPRMRAGTDAFETGLIKFPDGTGSAFGGLKPGPIADGLQDAVALP